MGVRRAIARLFAGWVAFVVLPPFTVNARSPIERIVSDPRVEGGETSRVMQEVVAAIVNPLGNVIRTRSEDRSRYRRGGGSLAYHVGVAAATRERWSLGNAPVLCAGIDLLSDDPLRAKGHLRPYGSVRLRGRLDMNLRGPSWELVVQALLGGRTVYLGRWGKALIGGYQHLDYYQTYTYRFIVNGAGVGCEVEVAPGRTRWMTGAVHVVAVAMGGIDAVDQEDAVEPSATGPGLVGKVSVVASPNGVIRSEAWYHLYWFFTATPAKEERLVAALGGAVEWRGSPTWTYGIETSLYDRIRERPTHTQDAISVRFYLRGTL